MCGTCTLISKVLSSPNAGSLKRLSNLSLWDNDLEFPPNHVVKQGTRAVVSFLKEKLREMEHGHSSSGISRPH